MRSASGKSTRAQACKTESALLSASLASLVYLDFRSTCDIRSASRVLAALASPPATKALDLDPFPCRSLRHVVYAALLHFGLERAFHNKYPHQAWTRQAHGGRHELSSRR